MSWSLSGAGQDTGWYWASVAGASLRTACSDADAHQCTGNTTTCCRVYTDSEQVSALCTLSSSSPFQCFERDLLPSQQEGVERRERDRAA